MNPFTFTNIKAPYARLESIVQELSVTIQSHSIQLSTLIAGERKGSNKKVFQLLIVTLGQCFKLYIPISVDEEVEWRHGLCLLPAVMLSYDWFPRGDTSALWSTRKCDSIYGVVLSRFRHISVPRRCIVS